MKKEDLFEAFGGIDDDLIEEAINSSKKKKDINLKMWFVIAACVSVIMSMTSMTFAVDYVKKRNK